MNPGSVGARMESAGYTSGFDYLRIGLAFAVVLYHSVSISGDPGAHQVALGPIIGPFQALILPMFFALSGFLVTGSLERSRTLPGFVTLRAIRIVPALAVEVLLSALILGPLLTTLPRSQYFTDHHFFAYFWNIVGNIHFQLPGVFETNPVAGIVNMSLWTVPFELECYLALTVLALFGLHRRRFLFGGIVVLLLAAASAALIWRFGLAGAPERIHGRALVIAFLVGVTMNLYRDRIPLSGALALLSAVLAFAFLSFPPLRTLSVVPAAYLTVWLGLTSPPKVVGGDYSYGVYLFAFPLQQLIATVPMLREWYVIFLLTIPISLLYAAFSWHCIEKPIMNRKKMIVGAVERAMLNLRQRTIGRRRTTVASTSEGL